MAVDEMRVVRPFKLIALICVFVALCLDVVSLLSPAWVTAERSSLSLWDYCKQTTAGWYCESVLQTDSGVKFQNNMIYEYENPAQEGIVLKLELDCGGGKLENTFFFPTKDSGNLELVHQKATAAGSIEIFKWKIDGSVLVKDINGYGIEDWQVATLVLLIAGGSITLIAFLFAVISLCKGAQKRCYRTIAVMLFISVVLQVCALVLYPIKFIDANTLRTYHEFNWGYGIAWGGTIFMLGAAILYCLNTDTYEEEYY